MTENTYRHWSEEIATEALNRFGTTQVVCAGWSPSGVYHIGNSREAVTCNAINLALRELGADSKFIFIVDDFDPLDKIPVNLKKYSKELRPYLGHPISKVPDFTGETETYAQHFIQGAIEAMDDFQIDVEFIYAFDLYQSGKYDDYIHQYWEKREIIDEIFESISGSALDTYISVICDNCGNFKTTTVTDVNSDSIYYSCRHNGMYRGCDHDGTMQVKDHNWKLKWRLDWPARQSFLGVTVEPSGKDHSVAGGSVDTALAIHEQIFQRQPPLLERYGFITMKGKKFSGSKGGALPANKVADILPTSAYLFLVYRSDLLKDISFNPESLEYGTLLDEYDSAREMLLGKIEDYPGREREFNKLRTAADLAMSESQRDYQPAEVKFSELTTVYQTSLKDKQVTIEKLDRLDKFPNTKAKEEITNRLEVLDHWLRNMAPDAIKIEFLDEIPEDIDQYWTAPIFKIWTRAIDQIEEGMSPDQFTEILREEADKLGVPPQEFYPPFYRLLTGKPRGPDASNLVLALGKKELCKKLDQLKDLL